MRTIIIIIVIIIIASLLPLVSVGFECVWVPVNILIIYLWQAIDESCFETLLILDDRLRLLFSFFFLKYNLSICTIILLASGTSGDSNNDDIHLEFIIFLRTIIIIYADEDLYIIFVRAQSHVRVCVS